MTSKNIAITSKNQITLPIEYVRKMHLTQNQILRAELRDGSIVLTPPPELADTMRQFWGKHKAKRPLTDEELSQAARQSAVKRIAESL